MSINTEEFLKTATAKIYNFNQKQKIKAELTDHIKTKKEFFMEIGYNEAASEEKAITEMGDAEEISNDLSKLYNSFYNPAPVIITYLIWFALLGGLYFLLKQFVFEDTGALPLILCADFAALSIFWIYSAVTGKKNNHITAILSFIPIAATSVFLYFATTELNQKIKGNISNLIDLMFNCALDYKGTKTDTKMLFGFIALFAVTAITVTLFKIIYAVKKKNFSNSKKDNKFSRILTAICIAFALLSITISALSALSFFNMQKTIYNGYQTAYNEMINICKHSSTFEEAAEFAENSPIEFEKTFDDDGRLTNLIYRNTYFYLTFSFETDENIDDELVTTYADLLRYETPPVVKTEHLRAVLAIDTITFKNATDSITLSPFRTSEENLQKMLKYDQNENLPDDNFNFFSSFLPITLKYAEIGSYSRTGAYTFSYISGTGDAKIQNQFTVNHYVPEYNNYILKRNEIIEIIKSNPDASTQEIEELTGTVYSSPYNTIEEYKNSLKNNYDKHYNDYINKYLNFDDYPSYAGLTEKYLLSNDNVKKYLNFTDFFDEYAEATYESTKKYVFNDDWFFFISETPYKSITFSKNNDLSYFCNVPLEYKMTEREHFDSIAEPILKLTCGGKYYDINGCPYTDILRVPYYKENGEKFIVTSALKQIGENETEKIYYLVNAKGDKYSSDNCFVNNKGYLVFNNNGSIHKDNSDDFTYKDSKGNTYIKAFESSWDNNQQVYKYNKEPLK